MKKNQLGMSMIEVLTALGIIALVLLSLLDYQISMIKNLYKINLKNIAQIQLMNFSDMLRANVKKQARDAALDSWNKDNAILLPQGVGSYVVVDEHVCEITINWFYKETKNDMITVYC